MDRTGPTVVTTLLVAASLGYAAFTMVRRILEQISIQIGDIVAALTI